MQASPKGMRLHIGIFGRRNAGKSSLLNAVTRQQVSIVSPQAGTTTDPVEKPIREIGERLQKSGWAIVSGMGGIGKTELVMQYIRRYKDKYRVVCFLSYDGSLHSTIASLPVEGYIGSDESLDDRYRAIMSIEIGATLGRQERRAGPLGFLGGRVRGRVGRRPLEGRGRQLERQRFHVRGRASAHTGGQGQRHQPQNPLCNYSFHRFLSALLCFECPYSWSERARALFNRTRRYAGKTATIRVGRAKSIAGREERMGPGRWGR